MNKFLTLTAAILLFSNPVLSQSYDLLTRAETGDVSAQMMLGDMFSAGEGVAQDYVESANWYRLAAKRGNAKAQLSLGLLYSDGKGVQQNIEMAYLWTSIAAMQGSNDAIEARDLISAQLDGETRDRVQQIATRCFDSKYTQCD